MCWISYIKPHELVSNKDINTFKICKYNNKGKIFPYYFTHEICYEFNKEYETHCQEPIHFEILERYEINLGFHSYHSSSCICRVWNNNSFIVRDIHGIWIQEYYSEDYCGIVKIDCIIPKGSIYYINDKGEIVSNKIILKGIVSYIL